MGTVQTAMSFTIYHNPHCSKSCSALDILQHTGTGARIINYITHPLKEKELKDLLQKLGMRAEELIRKKEKLFIDHFEGRTFSEEEWFEVLLNNQLLMERPIVVKGDKAIIARPPELVSTLL